MKKAIIAVCIFAMAAPVAAQGYNWGAEPKIPDQSIKRQQVLDEKQCKYEAERATSSGPVGSIFDGDSGGNAFTNSIMEGIRQGDLFRMCMEARGH